MSQDDQTGDARMPRDVVSALVEVLPRGISTLLHGMAIQFVYPDPAVAYGRAPTRKLPADQTGGRYRFVDARELYDR